MKKSLGAKTILFPTPVLIVGTYDSLQKPNIMAAAWGGICCSSPPCIAVSLRKATYSYNNLIEKKAFTVSIPDVTHAAEADYCGIASGRNTSKFRDCKLTPVKSDLVDAPYVKEFPFVVECKIIKIVEIGLHFQFIGEILDIKVDENCIDENNNPDIYKIKPFIFNPANRTYVSCGSLVADAFSVGKNIKK